MKKKVDDLSWQKQKLEDKLNAAELAELKRRKLKVSREDVSSKKEYEMSKELQVYAKFAQFFYDYTYKLHFY